MSYYDLDAILTGAEKIPCTFQLDVPELGYLDNNPGYTLKSGTKVLLPLWLAEMLAIADMGDHQNPDKSFIAFDLPPAVGKDVMAALKADPRSVPIRNQSPNFYNLAKHMMDLADERELHAVVRKTFLTRAADISLHARKSGGAVSKGEGSNLGIGAAGEEFLRGLDEWERILFRKAHDGARSTKQWIEGIKKRY